MQNIIRKENFKEQVINVWKLSIPAILTQIASIVMQYIDSAMVGNLGENASASIGLVSTTNVYEKSKKMCMEDDYGVFSDTDHAPFVLLYR